MDEETKGKVLKPLTRMLELADIEKQDSDTAYFYTLMYVGEAVLKLTVLGLLAASNEDNDRSRYRIEYTLARADGVGSWANALNDILKGPVAQNRHVGARSTAVALTQKSAAGTWQDEAVRSLQACFEPLNRQPNPISDNFVTGVDWYTNFAKLRNDTRGHGVPTGAALGQVCVALEASITILIDNLPIFALSWAYLRRKLSGKYAVTNWGKPDERIEELKRTAELSFAEGIYIAFGEPDGLRRVPLASSNPESTSLMLVNGGFSDSTFEMLCYLTNTTQRLDSTPYLTAPESLPPSETQGPTELYVRGKVFTNLPDHSTVYIARPEVEAELHKQLLDASRHAIVSLTGRGGIGKTSVAIEVISKLIDQHDCPYSIVVWFSARDIDLTETGPKMVRPGGVSIDDFADDYARWIAPENAYPKSRDRAEFFAKEIADAGFGPTLFVFDNFETMTSQREAFMWIADRVRAPNKALITSRENNAFRGDWPVEVHGMTNSEAMELIEVTVNRLGIRQRVDSNAIIDQSGGHPYVIKLLLGEMSRGNAGKPERILAGQDEVLSALFDRSYERLSPAAQRVFLTLCSWRSSVPDFILEPVLLSSLGRSSQDNVDVAGAMRECVQSSFIEAASDTATGKSELIVPLSARLFGQRKLNVSEDRVAIREDSSLLQMLGAEQIGAGRDTRQRLANFFNRIGGEIGAGSRKLADILPALELIGRKFPYAWVLLADLYRDLDREDMVSEERYLMRYVEGNGDTKLPKSQIWRRIAEIRARRENYSGELDAFVQVCKQPETSLYQLSTTANSINSILRYYRVSPAEKQLILRDVINPFDHYRDAMSATDFSRLGWLHMHLGDVENARQCANGGLEQDPSNEYCQRLLERTNRVR